MQPSLTSLMHADVHVLLCSCAYVHRAVPCPGWQCWRQTCPAVIRRQHGCHRRASGQRECGPEFRMTLLQVRHPLSTIASSIRGFCPHGQPNATLEPHSLVAKIAAFIPALDAVIGSERGGPQTGDGGSGASSASSCAAVFSWFWYHYYRQALGAADAWYRVEDTTPCEVAALAGMLDTRRPPTECASIPRVAPNSTLRRAGLVDGGVVAHGAQAARMGSRVARHANLPRHGRHNRHNRDGFTISWRELAEHHGGRQLVAHIRHLARRFGYRSIPL